MPKNNETYVAELENEKADLLTQIANYGEEQKASVKVFKDQTKLLGEKDKQLVSQEQLLIEKEAAITKLKTRIQELAQAKKKTNPYTTTIASDSEEIINSNNSHISTQTIGTSPAELEEQILEKRVANINDFGDYQTQLKLKDRQIANLISQLTLAKINQLKTATNPNKEQLTILISLLVIITFLLIFK